MKYNILIFNVCTLLSLSFIFSCNSTAPSIPRTSYSPTTGWNYDDFYGVSKPSNIYFSNPPGMVFIRGGMFKMGADQQDVRDDWNTFSRRATVNSFYLDRTEVTNIAYKEYIDWIKNNYTEPKIVEKLVLEALPDSLVWRDPLAYNEPLVEEYFHTPAFNNYPVVGVSWNQAIEFCKWRTNRVNENILYSKGYILYAPAKTSNSDKRKQLQLNKKSVKSKKGAVQPQPTETETKIEEVSAIDSSILSPSWVKTVFDTKSYKIGEYKPKHSPTNKGPKNAINEGIIFPDYRLPTEAEWEYAATGSVHDFNSQDKKDKKKLSSQELVTLSKISVFGNNNILNYKYDNFNFKRGNGNFAGSLGEPSDNNIFPGNVYSYLPNVFGLYNMLGNVSEWVNDVYRKYSNLDEEDLNPFRGNVFTESFGYGPGTFRDEKGYIKTRLQNKRDIKDRTNYNEADNIDNKDGDASSSATYNYGNATLINNSSRVYKGGSWNDRIYWLNPGMRRFLDQNRSTSTIGFRCAMSHYSKSNEPNKNLK